MQCHSRWGIFPSTPLKLYACMLNWKLNWAMYPDWKWRAVSLLSTNSMQEQTDIWKSLLFCTSALTWHGYSSSQHNARMQVQRRVGGNLTPGQHFSHFLLFFKLFQSKFSWRDTLSWARRVVLFTFCAPDLGHRDKKTALRQMSCFVHLTWTLRSEHVDKEVRQGHVWIYSIHSDLMWHHFVLT